MGRVLRRARAAVAEVPAPARDRTGGGVGEVDVEREVTAGGVGAEARRRRGGRAALGDVAGDDQRIALAVGVVARAGVDRDGPRAAGGAVEDDALGVVQRVGAAARDREARRAVEDVAAIGRAAGGGHDQVEVVDELLARTGRARLVGPGQRDAQLLGGAVDVEVVGVVGAAGGVEAARHRHVVGDGRARAAEVEHLGQVRLAPALVGVGVLAVAQVGARQAVAGVDQHGAHQRRAGVGDALRAAVAALLEVLVHERGRAGHGRRGKAGALGVLVGAGGAGAAVGVGQDQGRSHAARAPEGVVPGSHDVGLQRAVEARADAREGDPVLGLEDVVRGADGEVVLRHRLRGQGVGHGSAVARGHALQHVLVVVAVGVVNDRHLGVGVARLGQARRVRRRAHALGGHVVERGVHVGLELTGELPAELVGGVHHGREVDLRLVSDAGAEQARVVGRSPGVPLIGIVLPPLAGVVAVEVGGGGAGHGAAVLVGGRAQHGRAAQLVAARDLQVHTARPDAAQHGAREQRVCEAVVLDRGVGVAEVAAAGAEVVPVDRGVDHAHHLALTLQVVGQPQREGAGVHDRHVRQVVFRQGAVLQLAAAREVVQRDSVAGLLDHAHALDQGELGHVLRQHVHDEEAHVVGQLTAQVDALDHGGAQGLGRLRHGAQRVPGHHVEVEAVERAAHAIGRAQLGATDARVQLPSGLVAADPVDAQRLLDGLEGLPVLDVGGERVVRHVPARELAAVRAPDRAGGEVEEELVLGLERGLEVDQEPARRELAVVADHRQAQGVGDVGRLLRREDRVARPDDVGGIALEQLRHVGRALLVREPGPVLLDLGRGQRRRCAARLRCQPLGWGRCGEGECERRDQGEPAHARWLLSWESRVLPVADSARRRNAGEPRGRPIVIPGAPADTPFVCFL